MNLLLIFTTIFKFTTLAITINIENPSVLVFSRINNDILKINNISYRESINPSSFYYFLPGSWNCSKYPTYIYENVNVIYSQIKNNNIKITQKWNLLDSIQHYKEFTGLIHILAATNIEHNTNFTWKITLNDDVIYYNDVQNLNYIQSWTRKKGYYNIKLFVRHRDSNFEFYHSRKLGFTNSYQFGLWESHLKQNKQPSKKLIHNDNVIIENNIIKHNNQTNEITDRLNQQPITWFVHEYDSNKYHSDL